MNKKEFKTIIKEKFNKLGFKSRGNHHYKIIKDNILIGVSLEHQSYGNGYFIDYGVIYLPDNDKMPFNGDFDWSRKFWFTKDVKKVISRFQLDNLETCYYDLTDSFEYEKRSISELRKSLDVNIEKMLFILSDENCAIKDYNNNLDVFITLSENEIKKLIKLGVSSKQEVLKKRIASGYKNNSFLNE